MIDDEKILEIIISVFSKLLILLQEINKIDRIKFNSGGKWGIVVH